MIAAVFVGLYAGIRSLDESARLVDHGDRVLSASNRLQRYVIDVETGMRGYAATGKTVFLEPADAALRDMPGTLAQIDGLLREEPEQSRRVELIEGQIRAYTDDWIRRVLLATSNDPAGGRRMIATGEGKHQTDAIRAAFREFDSVEGRRVMDRQAEAKSASRRATIMAAGGLVAALLLVIAFAGYLGRVVLAPIRRVEAGARLIAAGDLTARAPVSAPGEIGELGASFNTMAAALQNQRARLEQANEKLHASNRELEQFASVASHDLQEPLRKVRAFGDRLARTCGEEVGDEGRDYIRRMNGAAERMQRLIDDLLTFSRISKAEAVRDAVDLEEVAREVLGDLEARLEQTGGRVEVGTLPTVEANRLHMQQLLQNLIGNALKFHRPGEPPVVRVHGATRRNGRELASVVVEDNGIGFDEQHAERIFSVFQRLHGRGEYEGTGIGLALCRKIAEQHGGTITAASAPGSGSTFIVTLPTGAEPEGEDA